MSNRVGAVALCFASVLMLFAATSMAASPEGVGPRSGSADVALGPVSSQLTYQGRLTDASGVPLSGTFNVTFQLWDDPAGGSQIGADIVRSGVSVSEGLFFTELDVPAEAFDGSALWLRIGVNGQWLSPRQALVPAPYALTLRPGAVISGHTAEPHRTLTVLNLGVAPALRAEGAMVGLHALGLTAIKGEGPLGVLGSGVGDLSVGVRGITSDGTGVEGMAATGKAVVGSADGDGAVGVEGAVTGYTSVGVRGTSQYGPGIEATGETGLKATGTVNFAVVAEGPMGVEAKGTVADGLTAETAASEPAAAVRGSTLTDAFGGYFTSQEGIAVWGHGLEGVHGESTSVEHVGVHGVSPGTAILGESTENVGVMGTSVEGFGVVGTSQGTVGVSGSAGEVPLFVLDGKYGVLASGEDFGINGYGGQVGGVFAGPTGVRGVSTGTGGAAIGVWGETSGEYGLYTGQKIFTGSGCVGCTSALLAQNAGNGALEPGEVVAVVGVASPLPGHETPRLRVRRAGPEDAGLRGVVQSRAAVTFRDAPGAGDAIGARTVAVPTSASGATDPGGNLLVVLQGLARVRIDAATAPIGVGDLIVPGGLYGTARSADGDSAEGVAIGTALEELDQGPGLVWVLLEAR